ncbi:conjugative transposon protein TraJ [Mucilaginibacter aquaedulcis]|uniref:conjugative transposon protein TraJ n=1 Tax=Mucilaginibacter aquaedulcis TaxID=1187081 RepID=UPI0025B38094|nr:conjugative transposon protein TraJ [Mucilaginibacter aquaedulcis]MDN3551576.1 conjugative transposon protein TraJ [Mucilaginibacter aquaedulcis]
MKRKWKNTLITGVIITCTPLWCSANSIIGNLQGLQGTLDNVYEEMLSMCSQLIGAGRAIAGFAALIYISARLWRHIAAAEPVDFYPLLRPFALGMAILLFPAVIAVMNGILKPVITITQNMVQNSDVSIERLLKAKEEALKNTTEWQAYIGDNGKGDENKWYKYMHPDDKTGSGNDGMLDGITNGMKFWMDKQAYAFKNNMKQWMSGVLEIVYQSAALCINAIRTFILIVLAILGPIVLGLSVFDGFQHTLTQWIAKYVNVYLWLPVANIFGSIIGKIQENMLSLDISQVHGTGSTFFSSTDTAYIIFLIIGIAGYFCVPSVAGHIVHAAGGGALLQKVIP